MVKLNDNGIRIFCDKDTPYRDIFKRPASVVRELVKNSIDAGADLVSVSIKNGGITYINVVDNGCGMAEEAAAKVFSSETQGLALSYISAISEIKVFTKLFDEENGTYAYFNYGNPVHRSRINCPNGTNITAQNLFYTEPEKYKHLDKDSVETSLVNDEMKRLCIEYPYVSIKFTNDNTIVFNSPGNGDLLDCVSALYGKKSVNQLVELYFKKDDLEIFGYASKPATFYPGSANIFVLVNGKCISNKTIYEAVSDAYKGLIPQDCYPLAILRLSVKTDLVKFDVGINKTEAVFSDNDAIYKSIYYSVTKTFDFISKGKSSKTPSVCITGENLFLHEASDCLKQAGPESSDRADFLAYQKSMGFLKEYILKNHFPDFSKPINHIGNLGFKYFFMEQGSYLYILDYISAMERITLYDFSREYSTSSIQSVKCNFCICMDKNETSLIADDFTIYLNMGFDLEFQQDEKILIRKIPFILKDSDIESFFYQAINLKRGFFCGSGCNFQEQLFTLIVHQGVKAGFRNIDNTGVIILLKRIAGIGVCDMKAYDRLPVLCIPLEAFEKIFLYQLGS